MSFQNLGLTVDRYREGGDFFGNITDATKSMGKNIYESVSDITLLFRTDDIGPKIPGNVESQ